MQESGKANVLRKKKSLGGLERMLVLLPHSVRKPESSRTLKLMIAVLNKLIFDHLSHPGRLSLSTCLNLSLPSSVSMTSPTLLRRAAAQRASALSISRSRSYSTKKEEDVDPQLGGYPQLPFVSRQYLAPKGWWDQQMRRNFGDTVSSSIFCESTRNQFWTAP